METAELIENGLDKNTSKENLEELKTRMSTDPDFSRQVKEETLVLNAFDEIKAMELKQRLENIESDIMDEQNEKSNFHPMLKWAAVFALFMMLSTWFFFKESQSSQELFITYYTIYPNVEQPVVRSDANQQGAWRLYSSGNYDDAYQQFQYSLRNGNTNEASWFYLGICAIELNRFNQAEQAFNKVISINEGRYLEQARWYMALTYLKANRNNEAKLALQQIESTNSSYSVKASELLNAMM